MATLQMYFALAVFGFSSVCGDIVRIGNEIKASASGIEVEGVTFLQKDMVLTDGVLFAFSAFFRSTEPAYLQVWRPETNSPNDLRYKLIWEHRYKPTGSPQREDVYIESRLTEPCVYVQSGDRVGVYIARAPSPVAYTFDRNNPRALSHTVKDKSKPVKIGETVVFNGLTFPYTFSLSAHLDTNLTAYNDSGDYRKCRKGLLIPQYDMNTLPTTTEVPITGKPGVQGATGPEGLPGQPGKDGVAGATGPAGKDGRDGAVGATGPTGRNGLNGGHGATGNTGPRGPVGGQGATGSRGLAGPPGPPGPPGSAGATVIPDIIAPVSFVERVSQMPTLNFILLLWIVLLTLLVLVLVILLICFYRRRKQYQQPSDTRSLVEKYDNVTVASSQVDFEKATAASWIGSLKGEEEKDYRLSTVNYESLPDPPAQGHNVPAAPPVPLMNGTQTILY